MEFNKEDYIMRIAQASPLKLVVITYELIISHIDYAIGNFDDETEFKLHIKKAGSFITNLVSSLDMSIDISNSLLSLYIYVNKMLLDAMRASDKNYLQEAKKIMLALLQAWKTIDNGKFDNPVLENQQTLYSNITYGRSGMLDVYDKGKADRGYTI